MRDGVTALAAAGVLEEVGVLGLAGTILMGLLGPCTVTMETPNFVCLLNGWLQTSCRRVVIRTGRMVNQRLNVYFGEPI